MHPRIIKTDKPTTAPKFILLLGDSLVCNTDNIATTHQLPTVLTQLAPEGWQAISLAKESHGVQEVEKILASPMPLPCPPKLIVICAGGQDALALEALAFSKPASGADLLRQLSEAQASFSARYAAMLDAASALRLPVVACTTTLLQPGNRAMQRVLPSLEAIINSAIISCALAKGMPVLDLRPVLSDPKDFSNYLKPVAESIPHIARAILKVLYSHNFETRATTLYTLRR
ncbi:MAG: GDSL-type esterase/lipase family protein [Desulfovibrionaceae bacterium]